MPYIINKSDGSILVTLQDGTLDTTTSLGLVGQNYTGYGEVQNENFVYLLENFASEFPPAKPIAGQTWFDTVSTTLKVYNGVEWISVGTATVTDQPPSGTTGAFWVDPETGQLYVYANNNWLLIGPELAIGFETTKSASKIIRDDAGNQHAVIAFYVNGKIVSVCSSTSFKVHPDDYINGLPYITAGINVIGEMFLSGTLQGTASSAYKLTVPTTINGVIFDGSVPVTVKASTTELLKAGKYIVGSSFDGGSEVQWDINGSIHPTPNTLVARDANGSFSATEITAVKFNGTLEGTVSSKTGLSVFDRIFCNSIEGPSFISDSARAGALNPGRKINGVLFDGTVDVTVPAAADALSGSTLSPNVVNSSLRSLGVLNSLSMSEQGLEIGTPALLKVHATTENRPSLDSYSEQGLEFSIGDPAASQRPAVRFISSQQNLLIGGQSRATIAPVVDSKIDIGSANFKFDTVHARLFQGEATSARYADLAEKYVADANYEPGTVLDFGGEHEVTLSTVKMSTAVAGVVSSNPAFIMNSHCQGQHVVAVALQGRVPCKVEGNVNKGDLMISSGRGTAISWDRSSALAYGSVIGKALENFNGTSGIIEVVVGNA